MIRITLEYPVQLLLLFPFFMVLSCNGITKTADTNEIKSQDQIVGLWLPIMEKSVSRNTLAVESTRIGSEYEYFYEFSADSFHYIELSKDSSCYHRGAVPSIITNGVLETKNYTCKIAMVADTLQMVWLKNDDSEETVYLTSWSHDLPKAICTKVPEDTLTPIDDLPFHEEP